MASVLGKNGLWIGVAVLVIGVGGALLLSRERAFIPEASEFYAIRAIPYDRVEMNCLHKAIRYANHLKDKGWERWVAVGHIPGFTNDHAWVVVVDKKGVRRVCDPTTGQYEPSGFPEKTYRLYKARDYYENVIDVRP